MRLSPKNCTCALLGAKRSERRNYKSNPVLGGALTTEAMDSGKSATESLSTTESIYKVKRNKKTKEHHQNVEV